MKKNSIILLTLLATPIIQVISYSGNESNKYFWDFNNSMETVLSKILSWNEIGWSFLVILSLYALISVIDWRLEKNEIRI